MNDLSIINLIDENGEGLGEFVWDSEPQISGLLQSPGNLITELHHKIKDRPVYWFIRGNAGYLITDVYKSNIRKIMSYKFRAHIKATNWNYLLRKGDFENKRHRKIRRKIKCNHYIVTGKKIWPL